MNISLAAEPIFSIGAFTVTNSLLVGVLVMLLLVVVALATGLRRLREVPQGLQNVTEALVEGALTFIESVTGNREQAKRFLPLTATIFFFVLISNWIGLLPGVGTIGLNEVHEGRVVLVPFLRSASADLNTTLAIALISVLGTQLFGIVALGFFKHAGKYLNFASLFKHFNFQSVILFFVGLLELVSEVAKVVSFSFRLFGNVFAGEVLLIVISSLVPYLAPLPFLFLEIFVGLVQALVFSLLTLVFLTIATAEHAEH
ncbi:MAG: F0F1 ATP synthase subunit A [Candidatus Veblenbacteria bacterium]|nr:F0F1 ATP synthase subunit A [Candidatus Veblenbacteria bacterium]MDZ4229679.1 F0F1 ATP synthase subunit A [Candidatus Veblenbacteria bacterium]